MQVVQKVVAQVAVHEGTLAEVRELGELILAQVQVLKHLPVADGLRDIAVEVVVRQHDLQDVSVGKRLPLRVNLTAYSPRGCVDGVGGGWVAGVRYNHNSQESDSDGQKLLLSVSRLLRLCSQVSRMTVRMWSAPCNGWWGSD
eukprot:7201399-Pyramimonas_sp.AAC.2